MTKKDYIAVAKIISQQLENVVGVGAAREVQRSAIRAVARSFATYAEEDNPRSEEDNPRFDRNKFLAAAGVYARTKTVARTRLEGQA